MVTDGNITVTEWKSRFFYLFYIFKKDVMVLTREEKEKLVLELHNRRTPIRIIAKEAGMSFRDIGLIVDKAEKEKEAKEGDARNSILSTKAYNLFSQNLTPVEVAIELNIREPDVSQYYKEYWKLKNLDDLYQIYQIIGDDLWCLLELFRSAQAAGFSVQHVLRLLRITNSDLPRLERIHDNLKSDVALLEANKQVSVRIVEDYGGQITALGKTFDHYCFSCQEEGARLNELQQKRMSLEALVRRFENNNPEFVKIRKAVEEKARAVLSNSKDFLRYAVLSVTESIKNNPDNYIDLISSYMPTTVDHGNYQYPSYCGYTYRQERHLSREEYAAKLVEEADKLYNKLLKELVDQTINDYNRNNQTSAIASPSSDEDLYSEEN